MAPGAPTGDELSLLTKVGRRGEEASKGEGKLAPEDYYKSR